MADQSDSVPEITRSVTRGTARYFEDLGCAVITELPLANGRRADVAALAADGRITLVEVKSGLPDFRSDGKWLEYLEFCDDFYFAVAPGFPTGILPAAADCGVIVADAWDASVLRPAPARPAGRPVGPPPWEEEQQQRHQPAQ